MSTSYNFSFNFKVQCTYMTWDLHNCAQALDIHVQYVHPCFLISMYICMQVPCHVCTLYFEIERKVITLAVCSLTDVLGWSRGFCSALTGGVHVV